MINTTVILNIHKGTARFLEKKICLKPLDKMCGAHRRIGRVNHHHEFCNYLGLINTDGDELISTFIYSKVNKSTEVNEISKSLSLSMINPPSIQNLPDYIVRIKI